jgi:hypothetical protein
VQLPNVLREAPESEEEVSYSTMSPAELLFEEDRDLIGNRSPAAGVGIDVCAITTQQRLMGEEAIFALVDRNAKPMATADYRLNLQQEFATDSEQAATNTADAASPVLGDFVEVERRVVDEGLYGSDDAVVGITDANPATYGTDAGLGKA